jgi:hypothetical protein
MRAGGGQANPDALLEFIDAGGDLDQAQADRVELGGAPGRALGQGRLERPDQPVRRGVPPAWAIFAQSWHDLRQEEYMGDSGKYRFRRYSEFFLDRAARTVSVLAHVPYTETG